MSNGPGNGTITPVVTPPEVEEGSRTTTSTTTNVGQGRGGGGQSGFEGLSSELLQRGVNTSLTSLLEVCSLEAITRTIAWWDGQQSNERPPGAGVLVETIRRGGIVQRSEPKSMIERERAYGDRICEWLNKWFPELRQDATGRPHNAAIAAVIRLHYQHGKGRLTKSEHGPEIRSAVHAFDEKWLTSEVPA